MHTRFLFENQYGTDHSKDIGVDGRADIRDIEWVDVDWIYLAQYRDQWRALVNTVMNIRVP
jgi:hypothetical protein